MNGDIAVGFDYEAMDGMALYRISDRLYQHREALEHALFARVRALFGPIA